MRKKKGGKNLEWTELPQNELWAHFIAHPPLLSQVLPFLSARSRRKAIITAGGRRKAEKILLTPARFDKFGFVFIFKMDKPDEHVRSAYDPYRYIGRGEHPQEHYHILCVINSTKEKGGRQKLYWLRTAPLAPHGTPHSSVAWTFGSAKAYYKPEIET